MASIDRIYGTKQQRGEFRAWCSRHRKSLLPKFYPWNKEWEERAQREPDHEFALVSLPERDDRYLMRYCPLPFVRKRLHEQYRQSYWLTNNIRYLGGKS